MRFTRPRPTGRGPRLGPSAAPTVAQMPDADPTATTARPHISARVERWFARIIGRILRWRGRRVVIEPYAGYGNPRQIHVVARALLARQSDTFRPMSRRWQSLRGWRRYLTAEVPGVAVDLDVAGTVHHLTTDADGYLHVDIPAEFEPGWHDVWLTTGDNPPVAAPILVVGDQTRVGIISDIDDTVMVTHLPRAMLAFWNAFVRPEIARKPVPGMSELYRRFVAAHPDAPVFYLSTGPWNVAPAIEDFLNRFGLPVGPAILTDWGPTNTGWFRSGIQHKRDNLARLAVTFPQVQWLLVGDDGQHDPNLYAELAANYPEQVLAVAIRKLSPAEQVLSHGLPMPNPAGQAPDRRDVVRVFGEDGAELATELQLAGIL